MAIDKKAEAGRIKFVLLERLGAARVAEQIPPDALRATLNACSTR
jgi:3-dehydroquinate synthetase